LRRTRKHFKENKALFDNLISLWSDKKEITRDDVEDYCARIAQKNTQTANKRLRLIKALFGYGVRRQLITDNPAVGIDLFPTQPKQRYIPPIEDVVKVLQLATEEQRNYLLVLINTMARVSEINNLKWSDVTDDYLILRTRKAKNSNLTERRIPLNVVLKNTLKSVPKYTEYVFHNKGQPYGYRSKFLRTLCKNAKVTYFSFHCLRHLGASRLADGNIPITDIQHLLGHSRASTTDIYLRSIKTSLVEAVEKLSPLTVTT
jgi:integrase